MAAGSYCEEVEEEDESWFADKIALNDETLIVVSEMFAVNLSEHLTTNTFLLFAGWERS